MKFSYRDSRSICSGCGATAAERQQSQPDAPQGLSQCPFCHAEKCCMCDMGDDVGCGNCDAAEEDD